MPADAVSQNEFYRAIEMLIVRGLMMQPANSTLDYPTSPAIIDWAWARLGLTGPFITNEVTRTMATALQTGAWQPLETIILHSRYQPDTASLDEATMKLAIAFIEDRFDSDSITRLLPALKTSSTLSDAISTTLDVTPAMLEEGWWKYLREQAGLPIVDSFPQDGELTLECRTSWYNNPLSIWRIRTDGTNLEQIVPYGHSTAWSPDGRQLAYVQLEGNQVVVDTDGQRSSPPLALRTVDELGWLPDGRLWATGKVISATSETGIVMEFNANVVNLDTGQVARIPGVYHIWSPDRMWVAYLSNPELALWIADAAETHAQQVAAGWYQMYDAKEPNGGRVVPSQANQPGYHNVVWSPDGRQLAFVGCPIIGTLGYWLKNSKHGNEIRVVDAANGAERVLVRVDDLRPQLHLDDGLDYGYFDGLAWSPDGSVIVTTMHWRGEHRVAILDANTGYVHTWLQGNGINVSLPYRGTAWSPDGRYLAVQVEQWTFSSLYSTVVIWDKQTGQSVSLPGRGWAWSPDGKWLAVPQNPGVLLVTPSVTAMHWLDTPSCANVAWRP